MILPVQHDGPHRKDPSHAADRVGAKPDFASPNHQPSCDQPYDLVSSLSAAAAASAQADSEPESGKTRVGPFKSGDSECRRTGSGTRGRRSSSSCLEEPSFAVLGPAGPGRGWVPGLDRHRGRAWTPGPPRVWIPGPGRPESRALAFKFWPGPVSFVGMDAFFLPFFHSTGNLKPEQNMAS